jgi:hypothetical protein
MYPGHTERGLPLFRKFFVPVAAAIRKARFTETAEAARMSIAARMVSYYVSLDPDFDRGRFLAACGLAGKPPRDNDNEDTAAF